ncbi:CpaF/VirB11 family protein [Paenibacillus sp. N1-5-1-14]|uniref:CpaF/VirB11 family protein n=1 Tax=Paenibacillus radicibacter TaxID=2972488 RepID=UPI00215932D3|nr:CpaF/VirB11 family protein [Paenibacillus radicibacter]MCR8642103.1 CpaF/VirB11 family protein [Paenibacillus radicibacter]
MGIAIMIGMAALLIWLKLSGNHRTPPKSRVDVNKFKIDVMTNNVKLMLSEITSSNLYDLGLSEEEFIRRKNKRFELKTALKTCSYGDLNAKTYVKAFIYDLLQHSYGLNETNIEQVMPFDNREQLTIQDQFEIMLHIYKKKHQFDALSVFLEKHDLVKPKWLIENGETESYVVTSQEIEKIYRSVHRHLTFEDKMNIIVQRIYQNYKGFSVIDDIRDMNIDGVSGGVSGIPSSFSTQTTEFEMYTKQMNHKIPQTHDSVWLFYKGKSVHLAFLSFGSEMELKRVCQNIYKYNAPGQLSESNGFKINEMKDGSRVVVVRPRFAESWAFFVRKFDIPNATLEQLVKDEGAELIISLVKYLVKGCRITAITGAQGSGKTTFLMAMITYISAKYNIRVQEVAFELHLRKIYKERNILSFRETDTISGQDGLDVQKKTDGTVNILGEVATDPVAAWMVQMAQVASLFTLFTHHAKTFKDLVFSLRNSLLKTGMFNNETLAEQQVISVINFDIHLKRDFDGKRYVERITECVPIDQDAPYPMEFKQEAALPEKLDHFMVTMTEYFKRSTDRQQFQSRNIIEFEDGKYVTKHPISERSKREMRELMSLADAEAFQAFVGEHWGEHDAS